MTVFSKHRQYIALALTVIVALSLMGAYLYIPDNEDDLSASLLLIDSWSIESGSYYPWIWINSTDSRLWDLSYATLEVVFSDPVTGEYAALSGFYGCRLSRSNESWSVQQRLSFQDYSPAEYSVDVYLNCTFNGYSALATYANAHLHGEIILPSEHPPLPRVLGIMFFPTDEDGVWHYSITIEDPDQDGDCVQVYASNKSGFTIWHAWANNTDGHLVWIAEGDAVLAQTPFVVAVGVTDGDGPYAEARFYSFV